MHEDSNFSIFNSQIRRKIYYSKWNFNISLYLIPIEISYEQHPFLDFQTLYHGRNHFVPASGQYSWRGYIVYLRSAVGGWRSFLFTELFSPGSNRRRSCSHVFHEFRENWQSEWAAQNRIGGLRYTEGKNAISWPYVGAIRDWYSTISHNW